eukprot:TRINITY_DN8505_c0_g6_i3.p1 TRINITY_DN8505_c0_g6~~TRINITY_DN8505_c0_g6_i3.p1  ORF type:complete len:141 (-),score=30.54 TRINITY_DN8505_c0_g6_i3:576-950(-)
MTGRFTREQYSIEGGESQFARIRLNPGQSLYMDRSSLVHSDKQVDGIEVKRSFCGTLLEQTPMKWKYVNDSEIPVNLVVNKNGGRILAFNSSLVPKLLLKESRVLAHTDNVALKKVKYSLLATN